MHRIAVFVDAGYLFAQGSAAITGRQRKRIDLAFTAQIAITELREFALNRAKDCSLLRIYWYDGMVNHGQMTSEQSQIAALDDVKIRMGFINSAGQQKGVDSLIVTDLIELARQRAIADAILLSGDEDVRVGVQIAQNYGVRVHLLGIEPSRGSQSHLLLQEADTTSEWKRDTVSKFLSLRPEVVAKELAAREAAAIASAKTPPTRAPDAKASEAKAAAKKPAAGQQAKPALVAPVALEEVIVAAVDTFVTSLQLADFKALESFWETSRGLPSDFDGRLLAQCRDAIGRDLETWEKRGMRTRFREQVVALSGAQPAVPTPFKKA